MKFTNGLISVLIVILLLSFPVNAFSEQDLWILEAVVNENYRARQAIDALIVKEKIFLPLVDITNLLDINLKIDKENELYLFDRPGDNVKINIDVENNDIFVDGNSINFCSKMNLISGKFFLDTECLTKLVDANFEYDSSRLILNIKSEHIIKEKEEKKDENKIKFHKEKVKKEDDSKFTLSNITYDWNGGWEKSSKKSSTDNNFINTKENWSTSLDLTAKGTLYDWRYNLGISNQIKKNNSFSTELTNFKLIYDMDQATFSAGKLGVYSEEELVLNTKGYTGLSLVSRVSPVMSSNGNIIQVTGDAPIGSKATLFVNDWEFRSQKIKEDEKYVFKDVLVYQNERANEIRVKIEKTSGEIENIYRYITVSDANLDKRELNYLTQIGKLDSDESENFLFNSIIYWGATEKTTLGLGLYSEFNPDHSIVENNPVFTYNSLRLNQQLTDKLLFKGTLYQNHAKDENSDTGYKINVDYQNKFAQSGVEYHYQAEQLISDEDERINPDKIFRYYYIQDITPNSVLKGKYTQYKEIKNPDNEEKLYELGYKIKKDRWKGKLNYRKNIKNDNTQTETDSIRGTLSYLITPNIKLIKKLGYESLMDEVLNRSIYGGIKGVIEKDKDSYILSMDWNKEFGIEQIDKKFQLAWNRKWPLTDNISFMTELGCKYKTKNNSFELPLNIEYSYEFPNDTHFNLNYQALWGKNNVEEKIEHKIMASFGGAFNYFDGEIVSTSPLAFGSRVGIVSGVIFRDKNRNGLLDKGETPLANIPVKLDRKTQLTNKKGEYIFKQVSAGQHKLSFDYNKLPIELTPLIVEKNVNVKANGAVKENLGLYIIGTVDGKIDVSNYNKKLSLSGIKLIAQPGGYETFTDYRGYFFFDQLPVGKYKIKIDDTTLPEWAKLMENRHYDIEITEEGEYISNIDFKIRVLPEKLESLNKQQEEKTEEIKVVKKNNSNNNDSNNSNSNKVNNSKVNDPSVKYNTLKVDRDKNKTYLNNKEIEMLSIFFKKDKIWAPLRAIAENFKARVYWNNEKKEAYIIDGDNQILFNIKFAYAIKNSDKKNLHGIELHEDYTFITLKDLYLLDISYEIKDNLLIFKKEK